MDEKADADLDRLWQGYSEVFRAFDDLTLARWMTQTLGQIHGRVWRLSHPLLGSYRLAAQVAHERQIWLKRLANRPAAYIEATCCRAPFLPLFTRELVSDGLICLHCNEPLLPFAEIPVEWQAELREWARQYGQVHEVAHWDEPKKRRAGDYEAALDDAALAAEGLLLQLSENVLPQCLAAYPAVVWEDHDECLDVRPEDILPEP